MRAGVVCGACGSVGMSCVRFTPGIRSCWSVLRSITPAVCRIAPNRTACGMLRSYSAVGRDRHSCVLKSPCGYRTWLVYFGIVRFFRAIPTEVPPTSLRRRPRRSPGGDGKPPGGRTNLEQKLYPCAVTRNANAVRRNRVASRSCSSGIVTAHSQRYRGEYAGAARPRLRQRVFDSLDSLHLGRGVSALYAGKPCAFYAAIRADPSARPYRRS